MQNNVMQHNMFYTLTFKSLWSEYSKNSNIEKYYVY